MNYRELEKANELYEEINKINDFLKNFKTCRTDIKVSTNFQSFNIHDEIVYFSGKHKEKIIEIIKEIRDEMVKKLNELGVTEVDDI